MHVCGGKLIIIGSDNGLLPGQRQAFIWTNGTKFNDILIEIHAFSFKKVHFKMPSGKWQPFCVGFNVLRQEDSVRHRPLPDFPKQVKLTVVQVDFSKLFS